MLADSLPRIDVEDEPAAARAGVQVSHMLRSEEPLVQSATICFRGTEQTAFAAYGTTNRSMRTSWMSPPHHCGFVDCTVECRHKAPRQGSVMAKRHALDVRLYDNRCGTFLIPIWNKLVPSSTLLKPVILSRAGSCDLPRGEWSLNRQATGLRRNCVCR